MSVSTLDTANQRMRSPSPVSDDAASNLSERNGEISHGLGLLDWRLCLHSVFAKCNVALLASVENRHHLMTNRDREIVTMDSSAPTLLKHSRLGIASCCVGSLMILIQIAILVAVATGVKDNQGTIYAFFIPLWMYLLGVPAGLTCAIAGMVQRRRDPTLAILGVGLTLAGPLFFVVSLVLAFRGVADIYRWLGA
jgi:hypothetical protein